LSRISLADDYVLPSKQCEMLSICAEFYVVLFCCSFVTVLDIA